MTKNLQEACNMYIINFKNILKPFKFKFYIKKMLPYKAK